MAILIVDDDPRLRDLLRVALERAGHLVTTASDGASALMQVARAMPDLVILDVGLPRIDGFEVCRRIRAKSDVPILFLTARDDEVDRIVGLELGADDYVTKPFSPREVVARVRAILKRTASLSAATAVLRHGPATLDRKARLCRVGTVGVALTGTEFELLDLLLSQPAQLFARARLADALWGPGSPVSDRTIDSHLRNLRRKLADAGWADAIQTLHGQGVRMAQSE